jgi:hypothetical protein
MDRVLANDKLLCGLALPRPHAREDVRGSHRFAGDDADLDFEVVNARVDGLIRVTLKRGDGLFQARGNVLLGAPRWL